MGKIHFSSLLQLQDVLDANLILVFASLCFYQTNKCCAGPATR